MNKEQLSNRLFKLIYTDLKSKGIKVRAIPKDYPFCIQTIYRLKKGQASEKTILNAANTLGINIETKYEIV